MTSEEQNKQAFLQNFLMLSSADYYGKFPVVASCTFLRNDSCL
jgi:hypothetical protein